MTRPHSTSVLSNVSGSDFKRRPLGRELAVNKQAELVITKRRQG